MQHLASLPAEDLLRETRRLRRLARELLFDRSRTDDVVQEAWLAALRGGPPEGWSLGAWLAGTARRLSLNANRSDARVRRREAEVARTAHGEETATVEALSRIETLRALVDAVAALDEPYRETIVLRFLDELPPRPALAWPEVRAPRTSTSRCRSRARRARLRR
jgi:RNA polymerase sigma factor (sigma-70 family)